MMEKPFKALRAIGTFYKVLGILAAVLTVLVVLGICATSVLGGTALRALERQFGGTSGLGGLFSGVFGGLIVGLFAILYGGGISITLYAF